MTTNSEIAIDLYNKGFNCAQAVLASRSEEYGLDTSLAKKLGGAFMGGVAYNGEVCGAVVGALMLIGLKHGQYIEGDIESKRRTVKIAKSYLQKFKNEFGSIRCRELLKCDINSEEGLSNARESGVFKKRCPILIKRSVELVETEL